MGSGGLTLGDAGPWSLDGSELPPTKYRAACSLIRDQVAETMDSRRLLVVLLYVKMILWPEFLVWDVSRGAPTGREWRWMRGLAPSNGWGH